MTADWHTGNANDETATRGWLLGHFMEPAGSMRATGDLEVKWGVHPAGQSRPEWTTGEKRTTLLLLVSGTFRLDLPGDSVTLERQGDYVLWGAGTDHSWQAVTDAVVVTVRWPSVV
ncbi:signal peptidase I [Microlunatus parietis]|uniref:Signal peptidase I n=1 Tax=Microlunatus parietis TaxID=682979 RepID=A0A7Y9LET4_9ACTN|nr:signal peptidase I [Microlunatus parietis]NYE74235.1 hypothetical protein [Microlunatus parietis]